MSAATTTIFRRGGANNNEAWDDSELIAMWNSQLDKLKQQQADGAVVVPPSDTGAADVSEEGSTTDETGSSEEDEESSIGSGQEIAFDFSELKNCGTATAAKPQDITLPKKRDRDDDAVTDCDDEVTLWMPPCPPNVPPHMQRVLKAWFRFGFECGKYSEASSRPQK